MARSKRPKNLPELSRRERQVMDLVYALGEATASEIQAGLQDGTSNAAVRSILRILVEKGHLQHRQDGPRYVYLPTVSRERARRSALEHVVETFFDGSAEGALAALLDLRREDLSPDDIERLEALIDRLRQAEEER